jgi:AraC family transcriptional regulator
VDGGIGQGKIGHADPMNHRSARGFDVAYMALPPGSFRHDPQLDHYLYVVLGEAVRTEAVVDGHTRSWMQGDGDAEILPAGIQGLWNDADPVAMIEIKLSHRYLCDVAAGMELDPDRVNLTHRFQLHDPRIDRISRALQAEFQSGRPPERLYIESLGTALTVSLLSHYADAPPLPQGLSKPQRRRVIEYIDSHLDADLSLGRLAEIAGLGTTHFQALFKRSMGAPVHKYVVRRRVERALFELQRGNRSIAEIALACGFAHQSHLARWMQRLIGVTPAAVLREQGVLPHPDDWQILAAE